VRFDDLTNVLAKIGKPLVDGWRGPVETPEVDVGLSRSDFRGALADDIAVEAQLAVGTTLPTWPEHHRHHGHERTARGTRHVFGSEN